MILTIFKLTSQQLKAIDMVFNNKVSILTGGAGTGKSTTIKYILKKALQLNLIIRQAAPTGKAAKRIIETSGMFASTIHSLLGVTFDEDGNFKFICNEKNPIFADLIILDEVSMIDNNLMYHFIMAVDPERTTLLLIGDSGQLPSVGVGAILRDMISSRKIPHIELDIIHRNSGKIVEACSKVRNGEVYTPNKPKELDLKAENPINMVHMQCETPEKTLKAIGYLVERMGVRGFDMVNDIQVISPVNKKGLLSCESINQLLKEQLNPYIPVKNFLGEIEPEPENQKFRINDKIINTKNGSMKDVDNEDCVIVNGDIGFIQEFVGKQMIVKFSDPERFVKLPVNSNKLILAYAITCHKFQGSQEKIIIIPFERSFSYHCNSNWLYTGLSRATTLCITVGDFSTIGGMLNNYQNNVERLTMLEQNIIKCFEEYKKPVEINQVVFEDYEEFGDI